jgi:single-stranded DNA-binding protein
MLNFSVAVDVNRTNDRAKPPPTERVKVTAWEDLAERLKPVLRKGTEVHIEGRVKLRW